MERDNYLKIGVDATADFGLLLCVGRIVAIIGIADQMILKPEGVNCFRKAGGERNDACGGKRDADGAASFVDDFPGGRNDYGGGRNCLRGNSGRGCNEKDDYDDRGAWREVVRQVRHESPLTRVVRETANKKAPRECGAAFAGVPSREGHATSAA